MKTYFRKKSNNFNLFEVLEGLSANQRKLQML